MSNDELIAAYHRNGGNIAAAARELGIARSTAHDRLRAAGVGRSNPIAEGRVAAMQPTEMPVPEEGRTYIITSAQNNTYIHKETWRNLQALADHLGAEILVGTFSYNRGAYGKLSTKRGKDAPKEKDLWYDPHIEPYIRDERLELAPGLQWCGEMNILPTAVDPLAGFETYSGQASAIFPHAKIAMRSIAAGVKGVPAKHTYTTGCVTKRNYVPKRAGLRAEHHHTYGGLIVEAKPNGWWVRQLHCTDDGVMQDLDVVVKNGTVRTGQRVEAITWGDAHALLLDPDVESEMHDMLDALRPRYQFAHDVMLGSVSNPHSTRNLHEQYMRYIRGHGWSSLEHELAGCSDFLRSIAREDVDTIVVDSNHDRPWLERWMREQDGRSDPANAIIWLQLNLAWYEAARDGRRFHALKHALELVGLPKGTARFLLEDESFIVAGVECGMHGHLGVDGRRGSPRQLRLVGRRSNIGHCHSAGIWDGLYAAGVSCELDLKYNSGPSSWSHSHIITYPTGKRSIVTMQKQGWRSLR